MRLSHVIVFVRDMQRSVVFYRDVLGLPLRFASPEWSEFAPADGVTLALHLSGTPASDDGAPGTTSAGRCRPGLCVPDLDACHRRMLEHGVRCLQEPEEVHGTRLAQYVDPDGLALSVSQDRADG